MGAIVVQMKAKPGMESELETQFLDLASKVLANEPGALVYQLIRSRSEPGVYQLLEIYKDREAEDQHRHFPHLTAAMPKILPCVVDGASIVEHFDKVG